MYIVYMHKNKINGKVYIGITENDVQTRWKNGSGYNGQYFHQAIEKYGWSNFEHIILAQNLTMAEADSMEKSLVAQYKANDLAFGYNRTKGGFGSSGRAYSDEDRAKMSKAQKQAWQDEERHKKAQITQQEIWRSKEGRAQRSQQAKQLWQDPAYSAKLSGENHSRSKPVICIETQQIFANARKASEWAIKANPQNIGKCCKGERAHAGTHPITGEKLSWQFYKGE